MNFLALCQKAAREGGVIAGLPSFATVANPSGRVAQLVNWINDAWVHIQNERTDWLWMRARFDATLTASTASYTAASLAFTGYSRVAAWDRGTMQRPPMSIYDNDIGRSDEGQIPWVSYDQWMNTYDIGVHDENRPTCWTISPANELLFGPTPDKEYKIRGGYRKTPQELSADTDEPEMPSRFHDVIIAEAISMMSRSDEVAETFITYKGQYDRLRHALVNDQTPSVGIGGYPLA